jgi:hypothetical protein
VFAFLALAAVAKFSSDGSILQKTTAVKQKNRRRRLLIGKSDFQSDV